MTTIPPQELINTLREAGLTTKKNAGGLDLDKINWLLHAYPLIREHVMRECMEICQERSKVAHAELMHQIPGGNEAKRWVTIELEASACKDAIERAMKEGK